MGPPLQPLHSAPPGSCPISAVSPVSPRWACTLTTFCRREAEILGVALLAHAVQGLKLGVVRAGISSEPIY